ncbi:hypothetical protein SPFL3102_03108 [Sporomusaceae bacterium FL31]|nr:hypothetical protein SPFL3101_00936 [Sporomusaceae bacterium FL31]GCE35272.1 hypothetical protein SPFL3102_03108 [Sporomusaceae bacterium]
MIEKAVACFFIAGSFIYLFFAKELSFGMIAAPKAGFLPILTGVTASVLIIAIMIRQLFGKQQMNFSEVNWRKFLLVSIGLIFYIIFLQVVGYIAATFIIMFYLLKVTDTVGWLKPGLLSTTVAVSFFIVFVKILGITLP